MMAYMKIAAKQGMIFIFFLVEISMSIYFFRKIIDIIIISFVLNTVFVLTGHVQHRELLKALCL